MVEMAPDFNSDSPVDWKPSGIYEGVIFLGQVLTREGQVFRRSFLREAMRILKPADPVVRVSRAIQMGAMPNSVSGMAQPRIADFLTILDPFWVSDIAEKSKLKMQPAKLFLCWLNENPDLDGAIHPLQEPHRGRWQCLGYPAAAEPGAFVESVWVLSYRF